MSNKDIILEFGSRLLGRDMRASVGSGHTSPIPPQGEWRLVFQEHGEKHPGEWVETDHPAVIDAMQGGTPNACSEHGCQLDATKKAFADHLVQCPQCHELVKQIALAARNKARCIYEDPDTRKAMGGEKAAFGISHFASDLEADVWRDWLPK